MSFLQLCLTDTTKMRHVHFNVRSNNIQRRFFFFFSPPFIYLFILDSLHVDV